jgi:hypothetical protein
MTQHWLQALPRPGTTQGVRFDLGAPTPDMVDFDAMATVLARTGRCTGHARYPYSVAQHCVEGALAIIRDTGRRDWAAAFLLHDGHEYVIGDIATPVRDALAYWAVLDTGDLEMERVVKRALKRLKRAVDNAIYQAAGIAWPLDPETAKVVAEYDIRMLRTERDAIMATPPEPWVAVYEQAQPVTGCTLDRMSEFDASTIFAYYCCELLPVFNGRASPGLHERFAT